MSFQHLSVQSLKEKLNQNTLTLIDIRDSASYAAGHIEGALNIGNHNIQQFLNDADKNIPIVVCCYHGNSSQGAAEFLAEQGFAESYSLDGGYSAWAISN